MDDKFIRRADTVANTVSMQHRVFVEDFVRQNYGKVFYKVFKISHDTLNREDSLSLFKEMFYCDFILRANEKEFLLVGKGNILYVSKAGDDYAEPPSMYGEAYEEDEGEESNVFWFEISTIDFNTYINVEKILKEKGFDTVDNFTSKSGTAVTYAFWSPKGFVDYKTKSFEEIKFDSIKQNYTDIVVNKTEKLLKEIQNKKSGLIILHGPAGTGKTWLIRSLLSENKNRRSVICIPPMNFIVDGGKFNEVVSSFNKSILVFEDIGDLLMVDAPYLEARANLLNLTEGLMSLMSDTLILITFNQAIGKIDPAVIRPGRCISNIEIGKLPYEHAQKLVGFDIPNREYTLAEVYEMKNNGLALDMPDKNRKMGF